MKKLIYTACAIVIACACTNGKEGDKDIVAKDTIDTIEHPKENTDTIKGEPYDTVYGLFCKVNTRADYLTKKVGRWYHTADCQRNYQSDLISIIDFRFYQMSIIEAEDYGFEPCPYCKPQNNCKYNKK